MHFLHGESGIVASSADFRDGAADIAFHRFLHVLSLLQALSFPFRGENEESYLARSEVLKRLRASREKKAFVRRSISNFLGESASVSDPFLVKKLLFGAGN